MFVPEGYRYRTPIAIRYGDMDTLGHVNNAKYLTYLEQSRVSYFRDQKLWDGSISATGMIVARVEIDFKAPITVADEEAVVWTRVSRLGGKSFDMEHLILVKRNDLPVTAAISRTVIVVFDYIRNATVQIPDAWRSLMIDYDGLGPASG
ncbi:MAG: acyl-CoA thioesterase [Chloroflexi bacterium]|nr:acyl-CoA thioesterase [Chloroflexota bacterium]